MRPTTIATCAILAAWALVGCENDRAIGVPPDDAPGEPSPAGKADDVVAVKGIAMGASLDEVKRAYPAARCRPDFVEYVELKKLVRDSPDKASRMKKAGVELETVLENFPDAFEICTVEKLNLAGRDVTVEFGVWGSTVQMIVVQDGGAEDLLSKARIWSQLLNRRYGASFDIAVDLEKGFTANTWTQGNTEIKLLSVPEKGWTIISYCTPQARRFFDAIEHLGDQVEEATLKKNAAEL